MTLEEAEDFWGAINLAMAKALEDVLLYGRGTFQYPPRPEEAAKTTPPKEPTMSNDEAFSYKRLIKLLGMTTSTNDAEALVALRAANRELDRLGKTWHEFITSRLTVVADPFGSIPTPPPGRGMDSGAYATSTPHIRTTGGGGTTATTSRLRQKSPPPPAPTSDEYLKRRPKAAPDPFATTSGSPAQAKQPTRISNRFAGLCTKCRERVGPGEGEAYLDGKFTSGKDRWSVEHAPGTCPVKQKPPPVRGSLTDLDDMMQF